MKNSLDRRTKKLNEEACFVDVWDTSTKNKVFTGTIKEAAKFMGCGKPEGLYNYIYTKSRYNKIYAIRRASIKQNDPQKEDPA